MDNKTDKQKTENISNFVDKQTLRTHPFGDNKMAERAYRRAERLVAAIYLLTKHIDSEEPIRRIIRAQAAGLLEEILAIRDEMRTVGSLKTSSIESSLRHLISLVRILAISGFVSFENADILTDALDDLGAFVETSRRSALSESIRLSREDLTSDVREIVRNPIRDKEFIKDIVDIKDNANETKNVLYKKDNKSSRRTEGILEVLRNSVDLSIKDIAVNLPEYGEKTIQRELADLIARGEVRKIGFKRWSRYALAASNEGSAGPLQTLDEQGVKSL